VTCSGKVTVDGKTYFYDEIASTRKFFVLDNDCPKRQQKSSIIIVQEHTSSTRC
jgi:hypothetical protein